MTTLEEIYISCGDYEPAKYEMISRREVNTLNKILLSLKNIETLLA